MMQLMQLYHSGQLQVFIDNGKNVPERFHGLDSVYAAVDVRKLKIVCIFSSVLELESVSKVSNL